MWVEITDRTFVRVVCFEGRKECIDITICADKPCNMEEITRLLNLFVCFFTL